MVLPGAGVSGYRDKVKRLDKSFLKVIIQEEYKWFVKQSIKTVEVLHL